MKNNSFSNSPAKISIDSFQSTKVERPELVKGGVGGQNHQGEIIDIIDIVY